jgi:3-isopropylmalate dehydrogenase
MQMMLQTLGEEAAAEAVDQAVAYVTGEKLKSMAAGSMGYSTSEVGDLLAEKVAG